MFRSDWFHQLAAEWPVSGGAILSNSASHGYAFLIAILGGITSFGAIFLLQASTAKNGTAMTVTFNKVGVLIPAILSVIFFHESPTILQILGVAVSMTSIVLVYFQKGAVNVITSRLCLLGTLFFGGMGDFISKVYESHGAQEVGSFYLFYLYLFSSLLGLIMLLKKDRHIGKVELGFGVITGVINQLIAKFLLRSLSFLPAFVVFPLFSVGVILTVNIINVLYFKEKLSKRQYVAIGLMVAACTLLNL